MTAGPTLFEAITSPRQSWHAGGFGVVVLLLLIGSGSVTTVFWLLGAWPVAGFMGVEVLLVVSLLLAHRRWSSRAAEHILLRDGRVRVVRTDGRGRREAAEFEAYWAEAALLSRPGRISEGRLSSRGRSVEIGRFLPEAEKADLVRALTQALRDHRSPRFDNPQLDP
ncbi:DUF2244 domain-containing protein [Muricoccus radiodurans]|uniref:DUF2244 domain-containing protein n=1 Tax=Muricoccus radiodurans TaxID=2231721 RepID=UPI003CF2F1B3